MLLNAKRTFGRRNSPVTTQEILPIVKINAAVFICDAIIGIGP